jgi:capsular polysaccharide transport system ATP-binding protein
MIVLENLCKEFRLQGRRIRVLRNANAVFPTGVSVALLGRNGAGKTTLLKMIGGSSAPTSGRILSDGEISFPVGFGGSFHGDMSGAQNCRFVARIYGVDTESLIDFVEDFCEIGHHFHLPLKNYSSGMRARFNFGVSMGLKFDTYLIDEATAVGDGDFKKKSQAIFLDRMRNAGAIFVSHQMTTLRDMCQAGAVLEHGQLTYYDDLEEAIAHHVWNMGQDSSIATAEDG